MTSEEEICEKYGARYGRNAMMDLAEHDLTIFPCDCGDESCSGWTFADVVDVNHDKELADQLNSSGSVGHWQP